MNLSNNYILENTDCLEYMKTLPDNSIDMILQDPPYNTTACKFEWDIMTKIDEFWSEWNRIIKSNGAIVMFGSEPFSSKLRLSNLKMYKYDWIWEKGRASGFVHAKNKPLKAHENISVFSNGTTVHANQSKNIMTYNPQMTKGEPYKKHQKQTTSKDNSILHKPSKVNFDYVNTVNINHGTRYPRSIQYFSFHNVGNYHPTQKPTDLLEYLIKTYTNENEIIFDGFVGSGSTIIAALNTNRKCIGCELDSEYYNVAKNRIENATININQN